jgi:hypothetical protein
MSEPVINLKLNSPALSSVGAFRSRVMEAFEANPAEDFEDFDNSHWETILSDVKNLLTTYEDVSIVAVLDDKTNVAFENLRIISDIDFAVGAKRTAYRSVATPEEVDAAIEEQTIAMRGVRVRAAARSGPQ